MEPGRKDPLLCSTVMWELENVPNKLGDTTKEISRQSVEGDAYLLSVYNKV